MHQLSLYISLYLYMKDSPIYFQLGCTQCCILPHPNRRHSQIPAQRLKTQVDEYLSQDDFLWEDALAVDHKLEQLETSIRKLRKETIQNIYSKKLSYALAWDKADDIENSFKLARDGEWKKLTCTNVFRVQEKVNKGRKVEEKDVKNLTRIMVEQTQKSVELLVKNCFANINGNRAERPRDYREERPYRDREQKAQERSRREEPVSRAPRNDQQEPTFTNNYPTVKINKVTNIDTHFNIVLKIIRVHKQFRINNLRKIQFLGGDETGTANVVIDYQRFIRADTVVSISNARIYSFHGSKQIQSSNKNSEVKEEKFVIRKVNENFNLSGNRRAEGYKGGEREEKQERSQYRRREDRPEREPREERRRREDRPEREPREEIRRREDLPEREPREEIRRREDRPEREPREERRRREDRPEREPREERRRREYTDRRPFRADRNATTYEEEKRPRRGDKSERNEEDKPSRTYLRQDRSQFGQKTVKIERNDRDDGRNKKLSSSSSSDEAENAAEQEIKLEKNVSSPKKESGVRYTKIKDIEPGDEELTIIAEIYQLETAGPAAQKGYFLSYIGDETAIVRMELPKNNPAIKEGAVIRLVNVNVEVDSRDHKITLKLADDGLCEKIVMRVAKLKIDVDMSKVQWESDGEEDDQEQGGGKQEALIEDL